MMHDAANEARSYQRQTSRAAAQKAVAELQAKGMQLQRAERRPSRRAWCRSPSR